MRFLLPIALLGTMAAAQSASPALVFDAADVHPAPKRNTRDLSGGVLRGERFDVRNATMLDLITMAYGLESDYVIGGPNWLELDRFDIVAKAPPKATQQDVNSMLRTLLADRFKLKTREEKQPRSGFALSLGKGKHKLKESPEDRPTNCRGVPGQTTSTGIPFQGITCTGMSMEDFANLTRQIARADLAGPVMDATGLKGKWDFELKFTTRPQLVRAGAEGIPFFEALDKQLGLVMEAKNVPTNVVVVESVEKTPTPNSPEISKKLPPPPPTEFEVSTIRPSRADNTNIQGNMQNGRLDVTNIPASEILFFAYNLLNINFVAGAPGNFTTARYDITAKAFADNSLNNEVDDEDLRIMVQNLMKDRFRLKAHFEDRDVQAFTLRADKSKLKVADPANRSTCNQNPMPGQRDPRTVTPTRNRLITCLNTTIAEFAERLQPFANGYLDAPVSDSTGLDARYDFSLNFSGINLVRGPTGPDGGGAGAGAADPTDAISLFDAISSQLGLKLEKQTRKLPVLVIDHMDDKPTEN